MYSYQLLVTEHQGVRVLVVGLQSSQEWFAYFLEENSSARQHGAVPVGDNTVRAGPVRGKPPSCFMLHASWWAAGQVSKGNGRTSPLRPPLLGWWLVCWGGGENEEWRRMRVSVSVFVQGGWGALQYSRCSTRSSQHL
jgi:hypothetical protein